jgi:hypothetical protein
MEFVKEQYDVVFEEVESLYEPQGSFSVRSRRSAPARNLASKNSKVTLPKSSRWRTMYPSQSQAHNNHQRLLKQLDLVSCEGIVLKGM